MAHHQGMGLLALNNVLLGGPMPRRFLSDVPVQSAMIRRAVGKDLARPKAPGMAAAGNLA